MVGGQNACKKQRQISPRPEELNSKEWAVGRLWMGHASEDDCTYNRQKKMISPSPTPTNFFRLFLSMRNCLLYHEE